MTTAKPVPFRIGTGYDIHRFSQDPGRPLMLGGIHIPDTPGLDGHSDADCLCHAVADAILGACGAPDIGHLFPNTDPAIKGIDSRQIVAKAVAVAADGGWRVVNFDCVLIAEKPRIAPWLDSMKAALADCAGVEPGAVGIKATTNEKIGALGRAEGIAAHAVCLLAR